MKHTISFFTIAILSACLHMQASDDNPSSAWRRAGKRLENAQGKTAEDIAQPTTATPLPKLAEVVAPADSETSFIATMRGYLSRFTGCITWDKSCASACPTTLQSPIYDTDLSTAPGFDQPITCKSLLSSCYKNLRGCSQTSLHQNMKDLFTLPYNYLTARCKAIALICQSKDTNFATGFDEPLYMASVQGDYHFAQFLLKHGANISADLYLHANMYNNHSGSAETARLLIEHEADVNAKDESNYTPLMALAKKCDHYSYQESSIQNIKDKADLLLRAGTETHHRVTAGDYKGMTALEIADSKKWHLACKSLADFLEDYEKQPNRVQE